VSNENTNHLVLFGAGKIGRSFIGQLFSKGGFHVIFIDVFKPVIDELNSRKCYNIVVKDEVESVIAVQNVSGIFGGDEQEVIRAIAAARILAVAVGQQGLKTAIPLIAKGVIARFELPNATPLDIILAENLRNAAEFMTVELKKYLPNNYPIEQRIGLIETSIGKMVPIMPKKEMEADILQVFAEPYNTLILDKKGFKNQIPDIEGLSPKENMKAWVDRKLFIHNLGHAVTAYLGYLAYPEITQLFEVLLDADIRTKVRNTMLQAAQILLRKYPSEFTLESLTEHIDDLIHRFQNKALGDTIFRVGCDLQRKLSAQDRIAGAIHLARELNLPYDLILYGLVAGFHFRATDEAGMLFPADNEFSKIYVKGVKQILTTICEFNELTDADIIEQAIQIDGEISGNQ
jgi:mannitol-1-phosphate 5-dehydrogenase